MTLLRCLNFILLIKFVLGELLDIKDPQLCKCEKLSSSRRRVINGDKVSSNDLRYVGNLYLKELKANRSGTEYDKFDYEFYNICTGVILNQKFFLTAAHW